MSAVDEQESVFLGVWFDSGLKCCNQVEMLSKKLSGLFVLRQIQYNSNVEISITAYYAIFHRQISYDILVWDSQT